VNLRLGARSFLRRSAARLEAASRMLAQGEFPEVVRFSQEATEFALKAALRLVAIEYPKRHDPGEVLRETAAQFPPWFSKAIPEMARLSAELARNRELAIYGDERFGKTAEELFRDPVEAARWLARAKRVHRSCARLFRTTGRTLRSSQTAKVSHRPKH
jgi:HEPN domain-containing protein